MPIRPQHRWLYPIDWPRLSALVRFSRARGRCECCRRPHGRMVSHLSDGRWWDEQDRTWRDGQGRPVQSDDLPFPTAPGVRSTKVVLATAHLHHDPTNNRMRNLKAFCQRYHMLHAPALANAIYASACCRSATSSHEARRAPCAFHP